MIRLKSQGPFEVQVTRQEFEQLIDATVDTVGHDKVVKYLKWKKPSSKYNRTTFMNRILQRHEPFLDHIDTRYHQRGKILAELDETTVGVKRRVRKSSHNWAEGIKESTEGNPNEFVRVAMVIRLLQTVREFYVDTSTMRLAGKTLKQHLELDGPVDDSPSDVARGVDT
jgi:hypothetical protein